MHFQETLKGYNPWMLKIGKWTDVVRYSRSGSLQNAKEMRIPWNQDSHFKKASSVSTNLMPTKDQTFSYFVLI